LNVYHLIDALPAAFFGLLGIWAAVVRRHWFLRFAVVCAFLLVLLLVPAFEIVIDFGIAMALIMLGVELSRERQESRWRFSLETALLAMVVVAVASAVVAKAPEFGWQGWLNRFAVGGAVAIASLLNLWIVYGRARWWIRVLLGLLGVTLFALLFYFSSATRHILLRPEWSVDWLGRLWTRATEPSVFEWGRSHVVPICLLGFSVICTALLMARHSRWFAAVDTKQSLTIGKTTQGARLGLITMMLGIFVPLCYVLYRLMTPTPYPVVKMPAENGYDDFLGAAKTLDANFYQNYLNVESKSTAELKLTLDKIAAPLKQINLSLEKEVFLISLDRSHRVDQREEEFTAVWNAVSALFLRAEYIERTQPNRERLQAAYQLLKLSRGFTVNVGFNEFWGTDIWAENVAIRVIESILADLNARECVEVVGQLLTHEAKRGRLKNRLQYERLAGENDDWQSHIRLLLCEWAGESLFASDIKSFNDHLLWLRLRTTQVALQAFFLEHGAVPETLDELVPRYLPSVPIDPFTERAIDYQNFWGGYAIASSIEGQSKRIVTGPAAPYLWQRLQESWQGILDTIAELQRNARSIRDR